MGFELKKKNEVKHENEEWDFDFSIYEQEDQDEEQVESIVNLPRPKITNIRSKWNNTEAELERLAELNVLISRYSIKVASYTQDKPALWKYYGLLDEFWESIRNIFGDVINSEVNKLRKNCRDLLKKEYQKIIPEEIHEKLLKFRSIVYRLKQVSNLGLQVERIGRSGYSKTKRRIVE